MKKGTNEGSITNQGGILILSHKVVGRSYIRRKERKALGKRKLKQTTALRRGGRIENKSFVVGNFFRLHFLKVHMQEDAKRKQWGGAQERVCLHVVSSRATSCPCNKWKEGRLAQQKKGGGGRLQRKCSIIERDRKTIPGENRLGRG